ncbi:MAG: hypothetical protein ACRDH8_06255 [Actinomycetota bacterium]
MSAREEKPLLPFTRLVLVISAVVQAAFGVACVFSPSFMNSVALPDPLPPSSDLVYQYFGALFLANAWGAVYAQRQKRWVAARTYLAISGPFVALTVALTVAAAVGEPGVPTTVWLYVGLAALYLPSVAYVWGMESARRPV